MPRCKPFAAAVLAGALLTAGVLAQGTGRWTTGTPMPSSRGGRGGRENPRGRWFPR
jgi:hypothetical protein